MIYERLKRFFVSNEDNNENQTLKYSPRWQKCDKDLLLKISSEKIHLFG